MYPILFEFKHFAIHTYGFFIALGFLIAAINTLLKRFQ